MKKKSSYKIAITGANGFVGSNLTSKLLQAGYEVTALVRSGANLKLLPPDVKTVTVDYNNNDRLMQLISDHNCLIHNAAITRGKNWQEFYKHNVDLTVRLINVANKTSSLEHFIFVSSQAASGCSATMKTESDKCTPVSYYGKSKLLAEEIVEQECLKNWTIVRPCSVYGEGDRDFLQYFNMVDKYISIIVGLKKRYISLIYVGQLTEYITKIVDNPITYGQKLFLSDGKCYSWEEFIKALEEAIGKKTLCIRVPVPIVIPIALTGELISKITKKTPLLNLQKAKEIKASHWICDASKAQQLLQTGFEGTLTDNLGKTYNWYKENKWL